MLNLRLFLIKEVVFRYYLFFIAIEDFNLQRIIKVLASFSYTKIKNIDY